MRKSLAIAENTPKWGHLNRTKWCFKDDRPVEQYWTQSPIAICAGVGTRLSKHGSQRTGTPITRRNPTKLSVASLLSGSQYSATWSRSINGAIDHAQLVITSSVKLPASANECKMTTPVKRKATSLALSDSKKPKVNASITSFFGAPKASSTSSSTIPPKGLNFDKPAWVASLTPEQKTLLQLEISTLHDSWLAHLKDEIVTPDFLSLKRFLKSEMDSGNTVFPPAQDVYSWSRHTPLPTVKAVILGQDPYHNNNQAHGLCFSVRPPTRAPPSLKNIYIALKKDYPSFVEPPNHGGLLTPWADRGVLMLNTCLTVRAHEANSHARKGWEQFTQKVIDTVAKVRTRGVVFLAWGSPAGQRVVKVDRARHLVLQSVHPSPRSAPRGFVSGHICRVGC